MKDRSRNLQQRDGILWRSRLGDARRSNLPAVPLRMRRKYHISVSPFHAPDDLSSY
jgi:hypothetical protein